MPELLMQRCCISSVSFLGQVSLANKRFGGLKCSFLRKLFLLLLFNVPGVIIPQTQAAVADCFLLGLICAAAQPCLCHWCLLEHFNAAI